MAGIVAVPLAVVAIAVSVAVPFFVVVHGRQRDLRQQLREVLFPVAQASSEYQNGNTSLLTTEFVDQTLDQLLKLSKRDGLKVPNSFVIGQLAESLNDIPGRFNMDQQLPLQALGRDEYNRLLENNQRWLDARVLEAGGRAAFLIQATHAIDNYDYRIYRKLKWHGNPGWTSFVLPWRRKGEE